MSYQLAQINIARLKAPLDDPQIEDFVIALDPINMLAEASRGFVWRLQTEEGNATSVQAFDDEWLIVNMSVWESLESLKHFTYKTGHVEYVRRRRDWFEKLETPVLALWWIPEGHIPTTEEAKQKLEYLEAHGETAVAFTFRKPFPPPEQ